ncbi:hypothetical protein ATE92_1029 [Ulvibacter sp. MAR_2010_11]|uniref:hypothetical protein n=1 Tax=Ulvibacter sp. MAR_2010_11 TaxID=1250229 RepID=UPI000CB6A5A8|nr:hypothetical protein [Ulvibacter sp. MAR_2010_11]PKA82889.1 hypothetical protein ATE92_1029 [Ulvibacter sp. MAR_2010_11]
MNQLKTILGLLGVSILLFSFFNCGNTKMTESGYALTENPPFTLGEVYFQEWIAGTPQGGSGTNVHITFENFTEDIVVQDIYFNKKVIKAQNSPQYRKQYVGYFKNEMAQDLVMDSNPVKEAQNTPPKTFPFALKVDEAVVSYLHKGKTAYYKISNMERKPLLAYPASNPNKEN